MSTSAGSLACDGMYSKLIDTNEANYDGFNGRTNMGRGAQPVPAVSLTSRPSGPGPYRLATMCLAALCGILLITIIGITVHNKSKLQEGNNAISEKQKQNQNISALASSISKLKLEQEQLQKDKERLQKENEQLQTDKEELQKEKDQLQKDNKVLEKEKKELQERLAATKVPATQPPIICPFNWHLFNNSCYFISRIQRDWPESKSYCESKGSYLAIIHTAAEQQFLWDLLPRGHWNAYWFGITDGDTEDQWKWVDGTPLVGGFWEVGEPNNHINEDCGYMIKTTVLTRVAIRSWYDAPCFMALPFICEKEMGAGASTAMPH
ncbi:uncharacterized protein KZ484_006613 isoform 2-T2 [Pholidichthys leucotaenia]